LCPWLEINFDDLVQKRIEAPWKPELMSFESEPISGAFSLQPIEEVYESTEDWLDNVCKHVAGWIVYAFLSCVCGHKGDSVRMYPHRYLSALSYLFLGFHDGNTTKMWRRKGKGNRRNLTSFEVAK
jgi:hypothetical protein